MTMQTIDTTNMCSHLQRKLFEKDVILYMFYLSQKDLPLAVQHPEIPLD